MLRGQHEPTRRQRGAELHERSGAVGTVRGSEAMQRFGESATVTQRACTLAVAPAHSICARRFRGPGPWRLAHPVVLALNLAADPGRGREALAGWNPAERVW